MVWEKRGGDETRGGSSKREKAEEMAGKMRPKEKWLTIQNKNWAEGKKR